jgi:predicted peptidase
MQKKRWIIPLLALAAAATLLWPFGATAAVKNKFEKSSVLLDTGPRITYWVYVPENAGDGPLPLVIFLHGSGERRERALVSGLPQAINEDLIVPPPAVYLVPQLPDTPIKWEHLEPHLMTMMERLESEYSIDESKVTLVGFSLGGNYAWEIAARFPDLFPRLACVCSRVPEEKDPLSLLSCDVRVYVGEKDTNVPPDSAIAFASALHDAGVRVGLFSYDGSHSQTVKHVFEDQDVINWLCWAE